MICINLLLSLLSLKVDFEDDEEEESRDGENSQLLSLDDTPEEQEAKYNYIERTRRPPSPLPDERIDEKDTDHRLFPTMIRMMKSERREITSKI